MIKIEGNDYAKIGFSPMFPEWKFGATKTLEDLLAEQAAEKARQNNQSLLPELSQSSIPNHQATEVSRINLTEENIL